jgi:integrase
VVVLGLCTGMRNKELRLCDVDDIDLSRKVVVAQHVKGEGSYGQSREIAMRPEAIGIMWKYLRARRKQVMQNCLCNEALFPALMDKGDGYLSSNSLIELKAIVEAEIGSRFDFRMCRRTYGQMAIDEGLPTDSLSVLMGHKTTKTTETYYARKRPEVAIRDAQDLWKQIKSIPSARASKIEFKNEVTGYA